MQIHELTRKIPLNELDIVGPNGLIAGAKAAYGALKQPGGAKDALRTVVPGQGQGALSTADLVQSDFAKRMQAVKNTAAMKQVAANIQQQWEQTRKTLPGQSGRAFGQMANQLTQFPAAQPPAPAVTPTASSTGGATTQTPTGQVHKANPNNPNVQQPATPQQPTAGAKPTAKTTGFNASNVGNLLKPTPGAKQAAPKIQPTVARSKPAVVRESQQLIEAATLTQISDWFSNYVIPQSMAAHKEEYLKSPFIQDVLKGIAAAENQTDDKKRQQLQAAEFLNLVSAVGAITQEIQTKQPQVAAQAATSATTPLAPGAQAATAQLQKLAGLSATQIEALKKIFKGAPQVSTTDPNTANFLQAIGIKTR